MNSFILKFITMKTRIYKFLALSMIFFSAFVACSKDGDDTKFGVQNAINAVSNKSTETTLNVTGELTVADLQVLKDIKSQLPMIENINLLTATTIPDQAFANKDGIAWGANTWLKRISAPNVTYIGQSAFARCLNLEKVEMPMLKKIDYAAFWTCESLKTIALNNVTDIEEEAFQACEALEFFEAPALLRLKPYVLSGCKDLKNVTLEIANEISANALNGCNSLIKLDLGCKTEIDFDTENLRIDTDNIDLVLAGVEATNASSRNTWKNKSWRSIISRD